MLKFQNVWMELFVFSMGKCFKIEKVTLDGENHFKGLVVVYSAFGFNFLASPYASEKMEACDNIFPNHDGQPRIVLLSRE